MKRALRAFGLAMALAAPATLVAQTADTRTISIGASGGLSLPLGNRGDALESGYALAGHVYLRPATFTALRFRADVTLDRFNFKGAGNDSFRSLGIVGNMLYDFPTATTSMVRPYAVGGLGLFNLKASDADGDSNLGIQVGGGLNFQLSGFTTFAEAKFVNVFTDGGSTRYVPITFGVRF
jgi:hypothetical protein